MEKTQIEKAKYTELIALCPKLGVKYAYQKKEVLRALLLDAVEKGAKPLPKKEAMEDQKVAAILSDASVSKSQRMRNLFDMGITSPSEIATLTESHYSFVYTVISKHKKRE